MDIEKAAQKPYILFVYFGGHGATENEKQIFLLNNSEPREVMYNVELKLRHMAK